MRISGMGMRRWASTTALALGVAMIGAQAWAKELVGQPTPGGISLQPGVTELRHEQVFFHDMILLPIIVVISLFVLALLLWVVVRYNKRSNPTPARWSHNTAIEIIWTVVPVLILMFIAIFSFRLLFHFHDMPKPDLTVKVTARQWNWDYEYPDQKIAAYTSELMPEADAKASGQPYLLAATEPLVVPVNRNVRVLVTAEDVIHAFAMPSFGIITDAVPGRINETWFKAEREGTYYAQCRELCGKDHAFMPIEIRVVSDKAFSEWVATKGGSMTPKPAPTSSAPATPAAEAASQGAAPAAATAAPAAGAAATPNAPAPTTTVSQQPAAGATPAPKAQ